MSKLTEEQRVQKAHVWLMKNPNYCLFSGVFMIGTVSVVDDDKVTAYTDGKNVRYGRKFLSTLSDQEVRALVLHENLHKAFRHVTIWKHLYKENPMLANMACDYVINQFIYESDPMETYVKLPESRLLDDKYRGLDAGTVYRMLKDQFGDDASMIMQALDEHDWDNAESMTAEEKDALAKEIDQALRQGKILAGKLGGNVPRGVNEILEPTVDWRAVLREFITAECAEKDESSWRRPSRRWVGQDVYMPSLIGESVGEIVVANDMSGSIDETIIGQMLGEIKAICETVTPEGVRIIYWDAEVQSMENYSRDELGNLINSTKPKGGGGTVLSCVPKYLQQHRIKPACVIVLTDGCIYDDDWGTWDAPVLFGITTDTVAPIGKTVKIG